MYKEIEKNEYEILTISSDLKMLRRIRPLCLQKAKDMCKFLTKNTNKMVCWYYNIEEEEVEIYTEADNLEKAKECLIEFEQSYKSTLKKRKLIIEHKHKKC